MGDLLLVGTYYHMITKFSTFFFVGYCSVVRSRALLTQPGHYWTPGFCSGLEDILPRLVVSPETRVISGATRICGQSEQHFEGFVFWSAIKQALTTSNQPSLITHVHVSFIGQRTNGSTHELYVYVLV